MTTGDTKGMDPNFAKRTATELLDLTEDEATLNGVSIKELAMAYGTPFFVYDADVLVRQYKRLRRALPEAIEIYYSIKANPHPKVIGVFVEQGAGCEIASGGEYVLAREAGVPTQRIVFAGPGKGRDELEYVVSHGIGEIHVEGFEEIDLLKRVAERGDAAIDVSIRVNPSAALGGGLLMGGQPTAFGFEEESLGEVARAVAGCKRLKLRGLHVYTGTQILDAEALLRHWRHAIEAGKRLADFIDKPLSTVDLGGGLGIPYFAHETELDLDALATGARAIINEARVDPRLANARFVVEPGRFLAGPAGLYVAQVRSVKICRGTTFVVLDGGMNHHLAASGNLGQVVRRDYPMVNLSRGGKESEATVVVVGPLCTPIDTLGRKVQLPLPRAGDLLGILQSGAYGLTASPVRFLSHPSPAEILVRKGSYEVISSRGLPFQ